MSDQGGVAGGDESPENAHGRISARAPSMEEGARGSSEHASQDPAGQRGGSPPSGPLWTVLRTLNDWVLLIAIVIYAAAFWRAISDLPGDASNYPRAIIMLLVGFIGVGIVTDLVRRAKGKDGVEYVEDDDDMPAIPTDRWGPAAVWARWQKSILAALITVVYLWVIPRVGYYEATTVYITALFALLGLRRPVLLIPTVGVTMIVSWLLFAQILGVRTPGGLLIG